VNTLGVEQNLVDYVGKIRRFQPNVRFYLTSVIFNGAVLGVYRLLFNFYILSQGYAEGFLGTLVTVSSLVALCGVLPAGFVCDRLGRKSALLLSNALMTLSVLGAIVWRRPLGFVAMNGIFGLTQSLLAVTGSPFLMENSGEEERSYLFSFSLGVQMMAEFVGNWLGGRLPTWIGALNAVSPTSTAAYVWALLCAAAIAALALIPLVFLKRQRQDHHRRPLFAPLRYAREQPHLLGRLISPMLVTSLGAGLLMPFLNVFYRHSYHQPDATIGTLFAIGSLAMGIGLLMAPPLADRYGKIHLVVASQAISIPFLFVMGFSPWFWLSAAAFLIRMALMNMSGPIQQAFVMEHVDPAARATVASLISLGWSFGWVFSPQLSGWVQERYGFGPVYLGTGMTYVTAVCLYYWFFIRARPPEKSDSILRPNHPTT
jgi:MFS family permease